MSSDDIEGRLRALAHTLHEPPLLLPHLLSELREVTPTLGVYFAKAHKEVYNDKVANMTQLGTLVSHMPHERRTRVWVGGMAAVSQLSDRSSPLAAQFFGKRVLLIWCGGQKPVGPSRNQVWAEPEAVTAGFWADKWHSFPANLAVTWL